MQQSSSRRTMDEEKPTAAGSSRPHLLPPPVVSFSGGPPKRPRIKRAWSAARKRMLVPGGTQPNSSLGEPTTETSSSASSLRNVRTADGESGAAAAAAARAGWVDEVVVEQYVEPEEWAKAGGLVGAAGSDQAGTGTGMPGTKVSEDASSYKERDVGGKLGPVGRFCMGTAWPKVQ